MLKKEKKKKKEKIKEKKSLEIPEEIEAPNIIDHETDDLSDNDNDNNNNNNNNTHLQKNQKKQHIDKKEILGMNKKDKTRITGLKKYTNKDDSE